MRKLDGTLTIQKLSQKQINELRDLLNRVSEVNEIIIVFGGGEVYVKYPKVDDANDVEVEWIVP